MHVHVIELASSPPSLLLGTKAEAEKRKPVARVQALSTRGRRYDDHVSALTMHINYITFAQGDQTQQRHRTDQGKKNPVRSYCGRGERLN